MTRYDIAMMCGYNSVEEYEEAEKRDNEIFFGCLKKQKPYVEKEPVKIQPVNQWISVDERLPKPFEKVLCYCISTLGDIDAYMIGCINKHWGLLKGETFVSEKETHRIVVYWQPLPPRPTIDYCRFCKKYGADMRGGTENDT